MKSKRIAGNPLDISSGLYTVTAKQYKSLHKKMYNCRTKLCWKEKKNNKKKQHNKTGKHFELFKELLRKLSPNPIFSSSVTTTTKPSYMTNSVVLKSRKWQ